MSNDPHTPDPPLPATPRLAAESYADPPGLDDHGFDPREFEWQPVARRPRADGWKPEVQRAFIDALADTGMVESAARAVDMSVQSAYRLRRAPGGESFARAWDAALSHASQRLVDIAFQRAIEGTDVPIFDRDGCRIGARWVYSDRLLMFLLRAYRPEQFRHAHRDGMTPGEAPFRIAPPVAEAAARLEPVVPPAPQLSMPRDKMEHMIGGARAVADVYEHVLEPDHQRERYRIRPVEPDHDAALARRTARRERTRRREREGSRGEGSGTGGGGFGG